MPDPVFLDKDDLANSLIWHLGYLPKEFVVESFEGPSGGVFAAGPQSIRMNDPSGVLEPADFVSDNTSQYGLMVSGSWRHQAASLSSFS